MLSSEEREDDPLAFVAHLTPLYHLDGPILPNIKSGWINKGKKKIETIKIQKFILLLFMFFLIFFLLMDRRKNFVGVLEICAALNFFSFSIILWYPSVTRHQSPIDNRPCLC